MAKLALETGNQYHYCPGCSHTVVHKQLARVLEEMDLGGRTIGIAPVGCAVLAYNYMHIDWAEAAHGRAPSVALGLKAVHPDNIIISYQGDGDLASIGFNETVHTAARGTNITVIFINNGIYGMTGGQMSPTTLPNTKTTTSRQGRSTEQNGYPIDVCKILSQLEMPVFIARGHVADRENANKTLNYIRKALSYQRDGKGYTFVEIISACPTNWHMTTAESFRYIRETVAEFYPLGVFRDTGGES